MRATITERTACKLVRGELRRVPIQKTEWPIGYHVCCPRCGYTTLAFNNHDGLEIDESADGHVSFSVPIRCLFCQVHIAIKRCEISIEEDEHVHHVQYR